ncbi:MAG TPA: S1 RNA-binding domain-containing protein [Candidatus Obscuribacterales bacterium]
MADRKSTANTVAKETVASGKVTGLAIYGVFVALEGTNVRGLLPVHQMSGDTEAAKQARLKSLKVGDSVEVLVTKVEEVTEGKKSRLRVTLSERALAGKRAREAREAREALEERVLSGLTLGTQVVASVSEVREGLGAFVTIGDGIAAGLRALVHVAELCEGSREQRDAALKALKAGESLDAEVIKVGRNDRGHLEIGLSAKAVTQREKAAEMAEVVDRLKAGAPTLSVVRSSAEGLVLKVSDGVFAILPDANLNGTRRESILKTKRVKVRIVGVDGKGRLVAAKA